MASVRTGATIRRSQTLTASAICISRVRVWRKNVTQYRKSEGIFKDETLLVRNVASDISSVAVCECTTGSSPADALLRCC